jgi:hypothetical protein
VARTPMVRHSAFLARLGRASVTVALLGAGGSLLLAGACAKRPLSGERARTKPAASAVRSPAAEASALALCSALHELPSRRRAECCAEPAVSVFLEQCVRILSAAVRAGTVSIESSGAARCAARVDESTRGCGWVAPTAAAAPAECVAAVRGLVDEGGRCTSSLECRDALHCAGQGATSPGVCRAAQAVGSGCGASVDSLATYLGARALDATKPHCSDFCDLVTHRCAPKPALGTPCRASVNCANDQSCKSGRCEASDATPRLARSRPGESCSTDLDCAAGGCVTDDGERRCAKKCAMDSSSLAVRPSVGPLVLGRTNVAP